MGQLISSSQVSRIKFHETGGAVLPRTIGGEPKSSARSAKIPDVSRLCFQRRIALAEKSSGARSVTVALRVRIDSSMGYTPRAPHSSQPNGKIRGVQRGSHNRMEYCALQKLSDEDLMAHLRSGRHDALAVIVDRYQRLVWSVAKRIVGDIGEAEDVVQIVFLDLFQKVELFDPQRGTLKVWLLQLAYTKAINRRYHLKRRRFYDQDEIEEDVVVFAMPPGASRYGLSTGESSRLVRQVMDTLNPNQRTAVELISLEGLTFEELASRTAQTLSNAKHHYYRGMMRLREVLSEKPGQPEQSKRHRTKGGTGGTNA